MSTIFRSIAAIVGVLLGICVVVGFMLGGFAGAVVVGGVMFIVYMPYYIMLHLIESKERIEKRLEDLEALQVRIEDRDIENRKGVYKYDI